MNHKIILASLLLVGSAKAESGMPYNLDTLEMPLMGTGTSCSPHIISCDSGLKVSFACASVKNPCDQADPIEMVRELNPAMAEALEKNYKEESGEKINPSEQSLTSSLEEQPQNPDNL